MTEIKLFNEWLETSEASSAAIALWYALMYIANRSGWKPELSIPASTLTMRTKLSRSTIYREREALRDHGLIDFDENAGRQSSTYRINGFESRLVSHTDTQSGTQPEEAAHVVSHTGTQSETQTDFVSHTGTQSWTIYKHKQDLSIKKNKDKNNGGSGETQKPAVAPKKEKVAQKRKKDEFDLSFAGDPVWVELLRTWLEYKRGRNQVYKSELSVRKFLTMLRNLSRGDPEMARQIIDKSIANNWAGIFELQDAGGQARGQPATGQRIGQIKQPEDEARRQKLLDKFDKHKK